MEAIKTLEQAKAVIGSLQSALDKALKNLNIARAIIFDLEHKDKPEPTNTELKARIVQLELDLKESIEKRQKLKELLGRKL